MDRRRDLPERQLWCAVIDRALQDATDTRWMDADSARQREVLEARQWFIEDGTDFRKACDAAGVDPDYLRKRIIGLIDAAEGQMKTPGTASNSNVSNSNLSNSNGRATATAGSNGHAVPQARLAGAD